MVKHSRPTRKDYELFLYREKLFRKYDQVTDGDVVLDREETGMTWEHVDKTFRDLTEAFQAAFSLSDAEWDKFCDKVIQEG